MVVVFFFKYFKNQMEEGEIKKYRKKERQRDKRERKRQRAETH